MSPGLILTLIAIYFSLLYVVAHFTSKGADSGSFFQSNRNAKWYLVAFGMIGTSLSGVTFISVPGQVGSMHFTYLQIVIGYVFGYLFIGTVLMPLYYRLNLISIYGYLEERFGFWSYKTGSAFFMLSRSLGSAARYYLVIFVLYNAVFKHYHIPFWFTVLAGLALIWTYTHKGGIKTIVYTDTLQSFFMIVAVISSIFIISGELHTNAVKLFSIIWRTDYAQIFEWNYLSGNFALKQILAGAFIAIAMTGLDQDLMQKNLSCRNIKEAQKNMFWFTITLVLVNILFLFLGAALYLYAAEKSIPLPEKPDQLYPMLATEYFPIAAGVVFILGIIAATYASTDSAITALTTSFCIDFLNFKSKQEHVKQRQKFMVHLGFSLLMFVIVLVFDKVNNQALILAIFTIASYTYGPLLGLYGFGLFTKWKARDEWVPGFCLLSPILTYLIQLVGNHYFPLYKFGFELLVINGIITFLLLAVSSLFPTKLSPTGSV
jgi:Na+/proline symporter